MEYILPLIIGFLAAFLGLLAPSMLNMTAARISIEKGKAAGIQFSAGAVSIVFIQGSISVIFTKYLVQNPDVILNLKRVAIFVLLGLSFYFFKQAKKKINIKGGQKKGNNFVVGLGMSSLNFLAIPFYLAIATLAETKGWMEIKQPYSIIYVIGAVLGSFTIFSIYAIFAKIISKKIKFIAQNINYILSALFIILSIITAFQVFS